MRHYITPIIDRMNEERGLTYKGVEKEVAAHFIIEKTNIDYPLNVECFGITFEDKNYEIKRENQQRYTIEYIVSGKGHLTIEGKSFDLEAGDVYMLEAGTTQHYYADKDDPFKKYWVNFRSPNIDSLLKTFKLNQIYYFPKTNISALFLSLFALENISSFSNDISYQATNIIFQMLMEMKKSLENIEENIPDIYKKAKMYIDNIDNDKLTLEEICAKLFITKPTLITNFKKYFGATPNQYRSEKKLQIACMLLDKSNQSINDIAISLGFPDTYTFSHWFKKMRNMSPSQYRNN